MRRELLRPATIISIIALFVALSGSAYAVSQLPKNSVGTKQLQNSSVTTKKIKKGAVTSSAVKDGSLSADDFASGLLGAGSQGEKGDKGDKGDPGTSSTSKVYVARRPDGASLITLPYNSYQDVLLTPTLPAGNYILFGKVELWGYRLRDDYFFTCKMANGRGVLAVEDDTSTSTPPDGDISIVSEVKLTQPQQVALSCMKNKLDDYGRAASASIIAVEVGSITGP